MSAAPTKASLVVENAQSEAARTLSISKSAAVAQPCQLHTAATAAAIPAAVLTYRPAMRGRAREAFRSIGQENLTSRRIPRTASLKKSSRYPHRDPAAPDRRHRPCTASLS